MKKEDIFKAIKHEIDYCESTSIKINPSFAKSQVNVLDLIDKYWLSQYRDGDTDSFGNPRPFYNITTYPVDIASKLIEFDVKDIRIISEDENYWTAYLMQKELHQYMKEKYFGNFLNQLAYEVPKYGHVVVKKVGEDISIVPLRNLRFRPDAVDLNKIPIVERHIYQPDEFLLEAKQRNWDNVDLVNLEPSEVIDNGIDSGNPKLAVFEAWFPKGFLPDTEYNYFIMSGDGILLAYSKMPESMYKAHAWEKLNGRTMGRGQVEKLFHEQIYLNRIASDKAEGLAWTSKHLFQTRDNSIAKNLLSQVDNGDVLVVNSEVQPVQNEERNLSFYQADEYKWETLANRKTFTSEQSQSRSVPDNAKAQMVNFQIQSGYFKTKREELQNFVKEIIVDWILPDFKNKSRKQHQIVFRNILTGDSGSTKLFQMVVNRRLEEKKLEMLMNGKLVMPDEEKVLKSILAESVKGEKIDVLKGAYDELETKIDIIIGNESVDLNERNQILMLISNMANNNPNLFTPSELKAVKNKLMEGLGFNPHDFGVDETIPSISDQMSQLNTQGLQRGGSLPTPQMSQMPQMQNSQTVA